MNSKIVVCGSGIIGMAMALALSMLDEEILLLAPDELDESLLKNEDSNSLDSRVYTISEASQKFLEKIRIWDSIEENKIMPVHNMEVYGDRGGRVNLSAWKAFMPQLAYIVEANHLKSVFAKAIQKEKIPLLKDRVISYKNMVVQTQSGQQITSELLIGADGQKSLLRSLSGICFSEKNYGDISFVATLTSELNHQYTAFQWFNNNGILALLPMANSDSKQYLLSMVWSVSREYARFFLPMNPSRIKHEFEQRIEAISKRILGKISIISEIKKFPLSLIRTEMIAPGIALIGDAGHCIHPLAGQGLNLGFGDVEVLSNILGFRNRFQKTGDMSILKSYKKMRTIPILSMNLTTLGLRKIFFMENFAASWVRNMGMNWIDNMPHLKKILIRFASKN